MSSYCIICLASHFFLLHKLYCITSTKQSSFFGGCFRDALPIFMHSSNISSLAVNYLPVGELHLLIVVTDERGVTRDVMDPELLIVSVSLIY